LLLIIHSPYYKVTYEIESWILFDSPHSQKSYQRFNLLGVWVIRISL